MSLAHCSRRDVWRRNDARQGVGRGRGVGGCASLPPSLSLQPSPAPRSAPRPPAPARRPLTQLPINDVFGRKLQPPQTDVRRQRAAAPLAALGMKDKLESSNPSISTWFHLVFSTLLCGSSSLTYKTWKMNTALFGFIK